MFNRMQAAVVFIFCLFITGCAGTLENPLLGSPSESPSADAAGPDTAVPASGDTGQAAVSNGNIVNVATIQAGDHVAGLMVESVEPFGPLGALSANNVRIAFSGDTTVDGEYTYHGADSMFPDQVTFRLAEQSRAEVPVIEPDDKLFLLFDNIDFAQEQFGPSGSHGRATVVIRDYVLERYPSSAAANRAVLVEVLDLRPGVLPEPKG